MNHSRRWSIDSARRDATLSALQALRAAGQFTRLEVAHWLPDSPAPAPDAEAGWTLVLEVSDDGVLESECVVPDGAEVAMRRRGARRAEVVAWTTVVSGTTPPGALSADVDDLGVWVGVDGVSRVGRVTISAESLAGIEPRTGLHVLSLKDCAGITDLRPLAGLTALHTLTCWGCDYLSDIHPLRGLTALRDLDLSFADDVDDLPRPRRRARRASPGCAADAQRGAPLVSPRRERASLGQMEDLRKTPTHDHSPRTVRAASA